MRRGNTLSATSRRIWRTGLEERPHHPAGKKVVARCEEAMQSLTTEPPKVADAT